MPTVFGYHDVKDRDTGLLRPGARSFSARSALRNIRTFIDPTNATRVGGAVSTSLDMDVVMSAMETPGAAEAMAHDLSSPSR